MLVGYIEKRIITGGPLDWATVTVVEAIVDPELFVAVRVYVVVTGGEIARAPDDVTVPIPLSMVTEVAPVTSQSSNENRPAVMLFGSALKFSISGGPIEPSTEILVEAVTVPALFVAVRVYIVVALGDTS
jgi:hypothetical protein